MKENEFLLNIGNKEILIEVKNVVIKLLHIIQFFICFIQILNHSIDFLIGNQDEQQTMRIAHKYGFHNPDDFLLTTRTIAKIYRIICTSDNHSNKTNDSDLIKSELVNLSPEFQKIVISALHARRREIINSLIREQNANECQLLESFDWDTRIVIGDSSYAGNQELLTTVTFNLRQSKNKLHELHFQMDYEQLNKLIKEINEALQHPK